MSNILILVAHPDDEAIFAANDLLSPHNNVTVLCFTNKDNKTRSAEFFRSMSYASSTGYILDLPDDLHDDWSQLTTFELVDIVKRKVKGPFDMIVSHDKNGEYGHCQHKRVHIIAKALAKNLEIPFQGF